MLDEKVTLNEEELEAVTGGNVKYGPDFRIIFKLGLEKYVKPCPNFIWCKDFYYRTWRGGDNWKKVGSEDMVAYVKRTLGANDPRYIALNNYCNTGKFS